MTRRIMAFAAAYMCTGVLMAEVFYVMTAGVSDFAPDYVVDFEEHGWYSFSQTSMYGEIALLHVVKRCGLVVVQTIVIALCMRLHMLRVSLGLVGAGIPLMFEIVAGRDSIWMRMLGSSMGAGRYEPWWWVAYVWLVPPILTGVIMFSMVAPWLWRHRADEDALEQPFMESDHP